MCCKSLRQNSLLGTVSRHDVLKKPCTWLTVLVVRSIEGVIPVNHGHLAKEIPGAVDFLSALAMHSVPWALVTSSTLPLVQQWRETRKLPLPTALELLVTAESVEKGKPDPAAYVLGRERLGMADERFDMLVIEDSPAGIAAGKAAGCKVIGLLTSHTYEQIESSAPDWILQDLRSLKILRNANGKVVVEMFPVRSEVYRGWHGCKSVNWKGWRSRQ